MRHTTKQANAPAKPDQTDQAKANVARRLNANHVDSGPAAAAAVADRAEQTHNGVVKLHSKKKLSAAEWSMIVVQLLLAYV